jgi:hypothetical protein
MRLIKLHRVLVIGGAALVTSCSGSDGSPREAVTSLTDGAANDAVQPSADAAPQDDGQGVDAWLSWVVTTMDAAVTSDAGPPVEDAAEAAAGDAGSAGDANPADAPGVDAWLSWA